MTPERPRTVSLTVDRTPNGDVQVSIGTRDANGGGHGYRLAGPKYLGDSSRVYEVDLDDFDVRQIRWYLALWDRIHAANVQPPSEHAGDEDGHRTLSGRVFSQHLLSPREIAETAKDLLASGEDPRRATSLEAELLADAARAAAAGHPWARELAALAVSVLDTPGERA